MGIFKSLKKIVSAPVSAVAKIVTFRDPLKATDVAISQVGTGVADIAATVLSPVAKLGAKLQAAQPRDPGFLVVQGQPAQGFLPQAAPAPVGRPVSAGGSQAFSSFSPFATTGGNPAWVSSTSSVRLSQASPTSPTRSLGRWEVSGTSVRLSA